MQVLHQVIDSATFAHGGFGDNACVFSGLFHGHEHMCVCNPGYYVMSAHPKECACDATSKYGLVVFDFDNALTVDTPDSSDWLVEMENDLEDADDLLYVRNVSAAFKKDMASTFMESLFGKERVAVLRSLFVSLTESGAHLGWPGVCLGFAQGAGFGPALLYVGWNGQCDPSDDDPLVSHFWRVETRAWQRYEGIFCTFLLQMCIRRGRTQSGFPSDAACRADDVSTRSA